MPDRNRLIRLSKRPNGSPTPDIFEFDEAPLPALNAGEFLVRNLYLSMDPALVGRMRGEANYAESVAPGEVMHCYGIGQVVQTQHPDVAKGEVRIGRFDMQQYALMNDASASKKINLGLAKPTWYLSVVGITGATAFFSLFDLAKPKPGETIVISAGASSVGSIVAQLAKRIGCRTVGIVSTDEKAARIKRDWGYDEAISYRGKSVAELSAAVAQACPNGVDIYYDNTSGDISEAILDHYNDFARIAVIGRLAISHLTDTRQDVGRRDNNNILAKRIRKQGFVLLDYQSRMMGAAVQLAKWARRGELRVKEDILQGFERVPEAFFRMLQGDNDGKQLVQLADVDDALDPTPRWLGAAITSDLFPTRRLSRLLTKGIG